MSKRKSATTTKRGRPKRAAQLANHAIVRSPKNTRLPPPAAKSSETFPDHGNPKYEPPHFADPSTVSQDHCKQTIREFDSKQGFDFPLTRANVWASQAKLWELTQANMQCSFEFAAKLVTIRSPVEILTVIGEFTSKRLAMFQKFSIEMAELVLGDERLERITDGS
jgi:hypothetical protein